MSAQGLSTLELRSIIEHGFLPLHCQCSVAHDASLTVRVVDETTGRIDLLVTGIESERLNSARAIADLIAELRDELATGRRGSTAHHTAEQIALRA